MSVKGRRTKRNVNEPTLLGDIESIINEAEKKGFIKGYEVDIEKIVEDNGIKIENVDLPESISGFLKYINGQWTIGTNKNHHIKRRRYTIAHEFAHYCLHRREGEYFEDTTFFRKENDSSIEFKANEFAAEILMPEDKIRNAIKDGIKKTVELADLFFVSVQALQYRVKQLGYHIKSSE